MRAELTGTLRGFMLLAALLASGVSLAAPAGQSLYDGIQLEEVPRLSLDTAYAVEQGGSVGPNQLYNGGRGYSIPGFPKGDSIIALTNTGREDLFARGAMYPQKNLSLEGEHSLYCSSGSPSWPGSGYSVFRPAGVSTADYVGSSQIELLMGVTYHSDVRLRITRNRASVASGFDSSLNDHVLLEFRNGALWAYKPQLGYTGYPDRLRLARMRTARFGEVALPPYRLIVTLNQATSSCAVQFGPAGTQPFENSIGAISTTLPPEFCDSDYQNQLVVALEAKSQLGGLENSHVATACLSQLAVTSRIRRR